MCICMDLQMAANVFIHKVSKRTEQHFPSPRVRARHYIHKRNCIFRKGEKQIMKKKQIIMRSHVFARSFAVVPLGVAAGGRCCVAIELILTPICNSNSDTSVRVNVSRPAPARERIHLIRLARGLLSRRRSSPAVFRLDKCAAAKHERDKSTKARGRKE